MEYITEYTEELLQQLEDFTNIKWFMGELPTRYRTSECATKLELTITPYHTFITAAESETSTMKSTEFLELAHALCPKRILPHYVHNDIKYVSNYPIWRQLQLILSYIEDGNVDERTTEWFKDYDNQQLLIDAICHGYEVEKCEPLYQVQLIPNNKLSYLNRATSDGKLGASSSSDGVFFQTVFTEEEIKEINPVYWNEVFLEKVEDN